MDIESRTTYLLFTVLLISTGIIIYAPLVIYTVVVLWLFVERLALTGAALTYLNNKIENSTTEYSGSTRVLIALDVRVIVLIMIISLWMLMKLEYAEHSHESIVGCLSVLTELRFYNRLMTTSSSAELLIRVLLFSWTVSALFFYSIVDKLIGLRITRYPPVCNFVIQLDNKLRR